MLGFEDTIVALSTPLGSGAIHIVRLSGSGAFRIVDQICCIGSGGLLESLQPRFMAACSIVVGGDLIDQGLVVRFVSPHSFTGEDLVELHLHGNMQIVEQVIGSCLERGARLATRGEFSRRAFLNGKMDLTQVEALADVISAESAAGIALAQRQLKGGLRDRIERFRGSLVGVLARLELELDFVEEGYEFASRRDVEMIVVDLLRSVEELLSGYRANDLLRRGARVLLLGAPNAGKSSLFNALIGFDRAIVSSVPGTTRDYVEERILFGGCTFHFIDSAGLRETSDGIEREGVERSTSLVGSVDLVLYVIDGSSPSFAMELDRCEDFGRRFPEQVCLPVLSKADLYLPEKSYLACSVYEQESVTRLLRCLVSHFSVDVSSDIALLSRRQHQLLCNVRAILDGFSVDVYDRTEVLVTELRRLVVPLGELTGAISSEEILNEVFGAFCIGK